MADYMTNVTIDTRGSRILDNTSAGTALARFTKVWGWLENDLQGETSTRR